MKIYDMYIIYTIYILYILYILYIYYIYYILYIIYICIIYTIYILYIIYYILYIIYYIIYIYMYYIYYIYIYIILYIIYYILYIIYYILYICIIYILCISSITCHDHIDCDNCHTHVLIKEPKDFASARCRGAASSAMCHNWNMLSKTWRRGVAWPMGMLNNAVSHGRHGHGHGLVSKLFREKSDGLHFLEA